MTRTFTLGSLIILCCIGIAQSSDVKAAGPVNANQPWTAGAPLQWIDGTGTVIGPRLGDQSGAWRSPYGVVWFGVDSADGPPSPLECPPTRYCAGVNLVTGTSEAFFTTLDCSGTAYGRIPSAIPYAVNDLVIIGGAMAPTLYRLRIDLPSLAQGQVKSYKHPVDGVCRTSNGQGLGTLHRLDYLMAWPFVPPYVVQ
jgi:hypothetical protein